MTKAFSVAQGSKNRWGRDPYRRHSLQESLRLRSSPLVRAAEVGPRAKFGPGVLVRCWDTPLMGGRSSFAALDWGELGRKASTVSSEREPEALARLFGRFIYPESFGTMTPVSPE